VEIVSEPDMRSAKEAVAYMKKVHTLVRYLEICDGNMQEGSFRCDANVSVRRQGETKLGTRAELKNLNSFRFVEKAIETEAARQIELIETGGRVVQETRLYDPDRDETRPMRSKEEANDYRYFPDPDLLPLEFTDAYVAELKADLPELPDQKKARFIAEFSLSPYDASVLVAERELADFYEDLARGVDAKAAANWLNNEILGRLNRDGLSITEVPVSAEANNAIIQMISDKTISGKIAKDLLDIVWSEGGDPRAVVEARGMKQVTDTGAIDAAIEAVIAANPDKVEEVKAKPKLAAWFVGQVMKQTGGKANPSAVNAALKTRLNLPDEG
jgi:aspartyl-tRNA(Asn)/glutamyl-tRNA(Gln) amidotransferase subunit B